jgi:hypothetical protein
METVESLLGIFANIIVIGGVIFACFNKWRSEKEKRTVIFEEESSNDAVHKVLDEYHSK